MVRVRCAHLNCRQVHKGGRHEKEKQLDQRSLPRQARPFSSSKLVSSSPLVLPPSRES
jgi:hypothetical protein